MEIICITIYCECKSERKSNTIVTEQGNIKELERQEWLSESIRLLSKSWSWKFVFLHRNWQQRDFIWVSVMTAATLVVSFCVALLFWTILYVLVLKVLLNSRYLRSCSAFCMPLPEEKCWLVYQHHVLFLLLIH